MNKIGCKHALKLWALLLVSAVAFGQADEKPKIICDHAAPPRGMHYVCKSQCDCRLEGKLKNDEERIVPAQLPATDLKITTQITTEMNGHVFKSEDIVYIKGDKIRRAFHTQLPDGTVNEQGFIDLCDARTAIELDPQKREYRVVELGEDGLGKGWQQRMKDQEKQKPTHGGTVEVITENIDTHETKTILAYPAHHWITKEKKVPGPGACTAADESETDGWYIDYAIPPTSCSARMMEKKYPSTARSNAVGYVERNGCLDRFTFTGEQMHHGMPVLLKYSSRLKSRMPNGKEGEYVSRSEREVTEVNPAPLDPKAFDIPAGYKRVARLRTDGPPRSMGERLQAMWEQLKIALGQ